MQKVLEILFLNRKFHINLTLIEFVSKIMLSSDMWNPTLNLSENNLHNLILRLPCMPSEMICSIQSVWRKILNLITSSKWKDKACLRCIMFSFQTKDNPNYNNEENNIPSAKI